MNYFARVVISTQDDATIYIMLTQPVYPEYQIMNKTDNIIDIG